MKTSGVACFYTTPQLDAKMPDELGRPKNFDERYGVVPKSRRQASTWPTTYKMYILRFTAQQHSISRHMHFQVAPAPWMSHKTGSTNAHQIPKTKLQLPVHTALECTALPKLSLYAFTTHDGITYIRVSRKTESAGFLRENHGCLVC